VAVQSAGWGDPAARNGKRQRCGWWCAGRGRSPWILSEAAGGQTDEAAGASLAARALPQDGGRSGCIRAPRLLQGELF
jgi:hypothetical protein